MTAARIIALDTSVLLRLLVGMPEDQAHRARAFYEKTIESGGRPLVSDLVISETYFALQFHYDISKERALEVIADFLEDENVLCPGVAADVLNEPGLAKANPGFVDRVIHQQYLRIHDADHVATFEKASRKLPRAEVL